MSIERMKNSRRHFLRNVGLTGLSIGFLPSFLRSESPAKLQPSGDCNPVTPDYYGQGPFYTADAPEIVNNQLAGEDESGVRLVLSGIVKTLDCSAVLPNVLLDIWHADHEGAYDNTGFNLRGKTYTNSQGFYLFETILPGKYLNGSAYRPSHIHFKITPPDFPTIITQLYFEGDSDIPGDAAASLTSGPFDATHRIIPVNPIEGTPDVEGTWDIGIDGDGTVGTPDVHLDKGIIYSVSPNPFTDFVEIKYGIFLKAKVNIQIFSLQGTLVATLDEQILAPQKYSAIWRPDSSLGAGYYFIALKLNDLQVHYIKILKV